MGQRRSEQKWFSERKGWETLAARSESKSNGSQSWEVSWNVKETGNGAWEDGKDFNRMTPSCGWRGNFLFMLYNDMEIDLFSEAHAGEEKWNGELSERSWVLQLIISLKVLLKLITMQQSCPLRFFFQHWWLNLTFYVSICETARTLPLLTKEMTEMGLKK